jgi:hypothetical protein
VDGDPLAAGDHDLAAQHAGEALRLFGVHGHRLLQARASALLGRALITIDRSQAIQRSGAQRTCSRCAARAGATNRA